MSAAGALLFALAFFAAVLVGFTNVGFLAGRCFFIVVLLALGVRKAASASGSKSISFARAPDVSGQGKPDGKAGQLVVCGGVDGGKQHFFGAALVVLGILGQVIGEGVRVETISKPCLWVVR
ncbi:MAG: hypothetical protein ACRYFU_22800 [Janthinobacterium lividum]